MIIFEPDLDEFKYQPIPTTVWENGPEGYTPNTHPAANWHSAFEFFYVTEGEGKLLLGIEELTVKKGEIYAINPYQIHRMYSDGKLFQYYYFLIPNRCLMMTDVKYEGVRLCTNITDDEITALFKEYIAEIAKKDEFIKLRALSRALRIAAHALKNYPLPHSAETENKEESEPIGQARVDAIIAYITRHYKEKITASTIATVLGYNRSFLAREFKKYTGQTLTEYINMTKCIAAHNMLSTTNETVEKVAVECGYTNISHFIKCYKRFYNCTPSRDSIKNKLRFCAYDN